MKLMNLGSIFVVLLPICVIHMYIMQWVEVIDSICVFVTLFTKLKIESWLCFQIGIYIFCFSIEVAIFVGLLSFYDKI